MERYTIVTSARASGSIIAYFSLGLDRFIKVFRRWLTSSLGRPNIAPTPKTIMTIIGLPVIKPMILNPCTICLESIAKLRGHKFTFSTSKYSGLPNALMIRGKGTVGVEGEGK